MSVPVLRGSYTPLITPFTADGAVDHAAFGALVERQCAHGAPGIVVTGTTGEPTSLGLDERGALYRRAVEVAAGRLEVVAATGAANHDDTIALTACAHDAGADAVMVVVPPFVKPSQAGLVEHFCAVAERATAPVLIYNIPGRSGLGVTMDTMQRIVERCPNVVGLKHASTDLDLVTRLLDVLGDAFRIFCGLESYAYPMLAIGGAGVMSAVGNLAPASVVALCEAVERGDHSRALDLHRALAPVNAALFAETNPVPLKSMLASEGLAPPHLRLPLTALSAGLVDGVAAALAETRRRLAALEPAVARA